MLNQLKIHKVAKLLIFNEKHQFLALKRAKWQPEKNGGYPKPNYYVDDSPDLIGGGVGKESGFENESAREKVIREAEQEAGILINSENPPLLFFAKTYRIRDDESRTDLFYILKLENPKIELGWKHEKYGWISPHEALSRNIFGSNENESVSEMLEYLIDNEDIFELKAEK